MPQRQSAKNITNLGHAELHVEGRRRGQEEREREPKSPVGRSLDSGAAEQTMMRSSLTCLGWICTTSATSSISTALHFRVLPHFHPEAASPH
jgi:hypothetical protein